MLNDMPVNDQQLTPGDIRQIENADQLAHFFARLNYDVDIRRAIPLDATAYASTESLRHEIHHHELIATDPTDADIRVYLFEVRSVTARLRNDLARNFLRTNDEKVLLVLTSDYEDIEFVYLERSSQKTGRKGLTLRPTIRPIPLTVKRRDPGPVELRVLKRFTFTEEDSDYQWEKLRSAYMLAEWSEEYFNNRALFSDYYLTRRLTDDRTTPEWGEDVRPIGREIFRHLATARRDYTGQTEDVIRRGLYEPVFERLGLAFAEQKPGSSPAEEPDYLLFAPGATDQPIATALTYVWNRNLDDVDTSRDIETPDEIPGAIVVSLLEAQVAPWVIVTNGKLWRLYSSTASNKATNYYEIDLEEAIAASDQITALKYWWLMFRRQAFTGFLDALLKNSADYAKELGERLKDRVFVEVFPQFAQGFIANMRAQGVKSADIDLDQVFSGTLTFLYRLMFTLYAESLELVPVNEVRGYREYSLYEMKRAIAAEGKDLQDEAPGRLKAYYSSRDTDLYARLTKLFTVIDEGSDDLNMPTYNGGLFSRETDSGRFLAQYRIPDRYLALGLDRLTRDVDPKTQALVFIDFKSLGVRQLGSIYEGLLEFRLRLATETLAVTKEKGKEVYQPAKQVKKPLATIGLGDAYLENDKRERKATGSYYTPDYIVKYIVRHTVGPVLDRKFDALRARLHQAQKGYRDYAKLVEARRRSLNPSSPNPFSHSGEKGSKASGEESPLSPRSSGRGDLGVRGDLDRLSVPPELKKRMTEIARNFRKEPTRSEDVLWEALRNRQLDGRKFRRQQPVGAFVLDFYCADERLAVEVDGEIHESQQVADRQRQEILEELGIRFVRITARQVENNLPDALTTIRAALLPSPLRGREAGGEGDLPSPLRGRGAGGEGDNPTTYWNTPDMQTLVDDCLNVRVLDPAMGSGHFLVEVVDYVSNRLIDFLNGWTENPVWAFIDRTRQDILDDMERQRVSIDPDRLTRVALLKRAVLKRCVYGVDLNAMAVELAKVSLWLDAFTLGAPLSFLDHHLKHGNSLIGARVADVQQALAGNLTLFSQNKFAGVMLATDLMRQVSYLSDNTIDQTRQSAQAYRDARDHLAPYKRVLDVYTSRWFGNAPTKGKKGKPGIDPTIEFLKRDDTQAWLQDPHDPAHRLPADDYMQAGLVAHNALRAAAEKRFFHWELEFPEVFFAPRTPGGQDVQLKQDGGFDAVVGNPPYDELSEDSLGRAVDERDYLKEVATFSPTQESSGRLNWYHYFMVLALQLLRPEGRNGLIVPMSWMGDSFTFGVRKWMLENHRPTLIEVFPQKDNPFQRVFFDAKLPTTIFVAERNRSTGSMSIRIHPGKDILQSPHFHADPEVIRILSPDNLLIPLVDGNGWKVLEILVSSDRIGRIADIAAEPTSGEIIFNSSTHPYMSREQKPGHELILRGSHVQRYEMVEEAKQGEPEYLNIKAYLKNSREDSKAYAHRADRIVYQEGSAIDAWRRVVPAYLPEGNICGHKICYFVDYKIDKFALLAIFASDLINWLVEKLSVTNSLPAYLVGNLPFPRIDFTTPADEREQRAQAIITAYENDEHPMQILHRVQEALASNQTDVIHDVLAHLAQRMIDLNQQKQAEVRRFLSWLENRLRILPKKDGSTGIDSLAGKTIIQNYLGDYQKGEGETPWDDFYYRLHQNRHRFAMAPATDIEPEYGASMAALRPIKHALARTDALIDKIVYRLYGLTDAEIELIERPQYEQALADAKAQALRDEKTDDEGKIEKIAEGILPAAKRFFDRVSPAEVEATLDTELPNWRDLPPDAPTFLLTGDYNLHALPDHMDFSSSVIPYTKAVEVVLHQRIFAPFRAQHTADDAHNTFLQAFMRGEKSLTLGSYMIILSSTRETALRRLVADADGLAAALNDESMRDVRNKAAHDEVLTRDEARQARAWALGILGRV